TSLPAVRRPGTGTAAGQRQRAGLLPGSGLLADRAQPRDLRPRRTGRTRVRAAGTRPVMNNLAATLATIRPRPHHRQTHHPTPPPKTPDGPLVSYLKDPLGQVHSGWAPLMSLLSAHVVAAVVTAVGTVPAAVAGRGVVARLRP